MAVSKYDSLYKIVIRGKEYVIEDAYCISEAIDWATTFHYEDCKEEVYNDDPDIVIVDLLENETYKWDNEYGEFVLLEDF